MCLLELAAGQGFNALNNAGFGTTPQGSVTVDTQSAASFVVANVMPPIAAALASISAAVANAVSLVQCAMSPSSSCVAWWAAGSVSAAGVSNAISAWAASLYDPSTWGAASWSATTAVALSRVANAPPMITSTFSGTGGSFPVTVNYASSLNISALFNTVVQRVCAPVSMPIIFDAGFLAGGPTSSQMFAFDIDVGVSVSALDSAAGALGGWFGCNATCMSPAYAPVSLFIRSALTALLPVANGVGTGASPWQWLPCPLPPPVVPSSSATQTVTAGLTPTTAPTATPGLTQTATASPNPNASNSGTSQKTNTVGIAVGVTVGVVVAVAAALAAFWVWRTRRSSAAKAAVPEKSTTSPFHSDALRGAAPVAVDYHSDGSSSAQVA